MGIFSALAERRRARRAGAETARRLYAAAAAQARAPGFYRAGAPDTVDGRFDLLMLHVFLLIRRLRRDGPAGAALAQALFDEAFADMDRALREMGVGDLGVPKRIDAMAKAFYGRAAAYDAALDAPDDADLRRALGRNLFETETAPAAFAAYVRGAEARLASAPLLAGACAFPPPP